MNQKQQAEWKVVLAELLKRENEVSPLFITNILGFQQYNRVISNIRERFLYENVKSITIGRTERGKKKTMFELIRNEFTENKLRELQNEGVIDKNLWFNYPRSEGGFIPPTLTRPPSNLPPDRNHKIYQITAENTLKKQQENRQLSLQI